MKSRPRILVVGTTTDYIDMIRYFYPERAVFLTRADLRHAATQPAPEPDQEALFSSAEPEAIFAVLAKHLADYQIELVGITAFDCESLLLAALIAQKYRLSFATPQAVKNCRDKLRCKQLWQQAGLLTPEAALVDSVDAVNHFFLRHGGKAVVKPCRGSGSELVFCGATPQDAGAYVRAVEDGLLQQEGWRGSDIGDIANHRIIVEELIEAPEYSADVALDDGRLSILRLARKFKRPGSVFGITEAYLLLDHPPIAEERLALVLLKACKSLGLTRSICMFDFFIREGEVVLLEAAPRPGGDCLPFVYQHATGRNLLQMTLDFSVDPASACGKLADIRPHLGVRLFAERAGVVDKVDVGGLESLPTVQEIVLYHRGPGWKVVLPPTDYDSWVLGHVTVRPEEKDDVVGWIDAVRQQTRLVYQAEPGEIAVAESDVLTPRVRQFFAAKDHYLSLWQRYQQPLYVLEEAVLQQRAEEFRRTFDRHLPDTGYYFAMKSNNHPAVSRILLQKGYGLDVSSGLELEAALALGATDLVFSGPGKTEAELSLALRHVEKIVFLADSIREAEKIAHLAKKTDVVAKIGIRLSTGSDPLWRKFGIGLKQLQPFWQTVKGLPNLDFCGIQFHTSWNVSPDAQVEFVRQLANVLLELPPDFIARIRFIDIGGGYWPPQGEWLRHDQSKRFRHIPAEPLEAFAQKISQALHRDIFPLVRCKICFEPGRWLCNDAVQILMSVVDQKESDIIITDAAINAVGWDRFETDYFPVLNLSRPAMLERPCHIFGSLCTPHDVWGYSYWGSDIQEGDVLMVPLQGAYTFSLRQSFIKPLPKVVVI